MCPCLSPAGCCRNASHNPSTARVGNHQPVEIRQARRSRPATMTSASDLDAHKGDMWSCVFAFDVMVWTAAPFPSWPRPHLRPQRLTSSRPSAGTWAGLRLPVACPTHPTLTFARSGDLCPQQHASATRPSSTRHTWSGWEDTRPACARPADHQPPSSSHVLRGPDAGLIAPLTAGDHVLGRGLTTPLTSPPMSPRSRAAAALLDPDHARRPLLDQRHDSRGRGAAPRAAAALCQ